MPRLLALLSGLVLATGLTLSWPFATDTVVAFAQEEERARLSEARARLAEIGDELEQAETERSETQEALADADETLREIEDIVNEVTLSVERQRAAVGDAERRLSQVEREAAALEDAFDDRIARLYMQGPELSFEVLLSSSGADEAIARTVLLERLAEGDQVDLERLEATRIAVDAERRRLAEERQELEERLEEQQDVLADAQQLREQRALAAADARERAARLAREHDDLEDHEARLSALVRERQAEAERERRAEAAAPATAAGSGAPASSAASSSGYAWPMCAPVTSGYGPRWGRMHRGIDQGASTGTAIGAVAAGRVIFAGWQGGYGNLLMIDHGGVVTAYAHQSRFAVGTGTRVSQGQTIGYVGTTGNSTGPHLHLEFRRNGSSVNPRQYLSGSPC